MGRAETCRKDLLARDVIAYESSSGVLAGVYSLETSDLLWEPERALWLSFDPYSPLIVSVSDSFLLDQASGEAIAALELDANENRGMRIPGPDSVLMLTGDGLQQGGSDGEVQWTIASDVYSEFAVYGQTLVVVNTAGEIIDVNRATGTELGSLPALPEERFPGWDWCVETNVDDGRVWRFLPVDDGR